MNFEELAISRRSTRKFTDRKIDRETIQKILDITMTAPSSKNLRTTRIAVTEDKNIMSIIADMRSTGAGFVKDAPLVFFIMGDEIQTDMWRENCSISATVLQFAAESLGLGSCWVQVFGRPHRDDNPQGITAEEYLRQSIPGLRNYRIMCVVACGYPEKRHNPHSLKDDADKIIWL